MSPWEVEASLRKMRRDMEDFPRPAPRHWPYMHRTVAEVWCEVCRMPPEPESCVYWQCPHKARA
jgi:hypothetical protein